MQNYTYSLFSRNTHSSQSMTMLMWTQQAGTSPSLFSDYISPAQVCEFF